jgi:hypothetical protein
MFLVAWALSAFGGGCADHRAWTRADDWYHPAEYRANASLLKPVPWAAVRPEMRARAEQRLERSAAVPLAPDEMADYAGAPFDHPGMEVFLVRAVYLSPSGQFYVRTDGHDLYVNHGSLGRRPMPMGRQPLIVALPSEPGNVYVSCGMAE